MGEPHTEGKIVINDSIIEQVTDFTYLGYRISEYGSDLEDKLQTYNKINGVIRRHFGTQMNKETKLRIHNITAKASACNTDTTPTQPHRISNTHRTKNNTTNVVIQQNSRKLLMTDVLISETC